MLASQKHRGGGKGNRRRGKGGGGGEMEYVKEDVRTLDMTSDRKVEDKNLGDMNYEVKDKGR